MIKITEKNRSFVFLGGTMLMGVLIIGVLAFWETTGVDPVEVVNEQANTNYVELETAIDSLKNANFRPDSYSTLLTRIDASHQQDLITADAKEELVSRLTDTYSGLVYNQCEFFLTGTNLHSDTEVLDWLSQLEKITGPDDKTGHYKGQIAAYNYYMDTLPEKVEDFISGGVENYNDETYKELKDEVTGLTRLDPPYRTTAKLNTLMASLKSGLEEFNSEWATQDTQLQYPSNAF
jgi:hypothetical protein